MRIRAASDWSIVLYYWSWTNTDRFRHREQHIYGYELEAERALTLAREVKSVLERVEAAVATFNAWLEEKEERKE